MNMSAKDFNFLLIILTSFIRMIHSSNKINVHQKLPFNPEVSMTAEEIIRHRGYPVETHSVTTEDGYILELRRIPSRLNNKAKPVFFQYGFLGSDALWSLSPANRSLAYLLSDRGYDVWMGNSRGNTYSRKHVTLNPKESEYWNFSWDEMSRFDIPASLLYVLKTTEQEKLSYIGNSLGCTLFFMAMAARPELNKLIDVMIALGPVSTLDNINLSTRLMAFFWPIIRFAAEKVLRYKNAGDLLANPFFQYVRKLSCERTYRTAASCRDIIHADLGFNPDNFDLTVIPSLHKFIPNGMSFNGVAHGMQHVRRDGGLSAFDYGRKENLKRYGSPKPPSYDLSLVTAPVYIFWSPNDRIASTEDITWLVSKLGNLKASIQVPDPKFNHFDYVIGLNAKEVLYRTIFPLLPEP